jgi:hypothetical protein
MKQAHSMIYTSLLGVAEYYDTSFSLMLEALIHFLEGRRDRGSMVSTFAILKRMASLSLHLPTEGTLALMSLIARAIRGDGRYLQVLENNQGGMGVYLPENDDPELCNAMAASLWELSLLSSHFNPSVRDVSRSFATPNGSSFPTDPPFIYLKKYDTSKGVLTPPPPTPPMHPLQKIILKERKKADSTDSKKKKKERYHFIRPQSDHSEEDAAVLAGVDKTMASLEESAEKAMGEYFETHLAFEEEKEARKMNTLSQLRQIMEAYEEYKRRKEESAAVVNAKAGAKRKAEEEKPKQRVVSAAVEGEVHHPPAIQEHAEEDIIVQTPSRRKKRRLNT